MNRLCLALLMFAVGSALIGCAEKKETPEKPREAVSAPAEVAVQKPVEPELSVPVPEKAEAQKKAPPPDQKAQAAVEKVKAAEKAIEVKAVEAVKPVEKKAVQAEKAVEKALASAAPEGDAAAGAQIFKKKCAPCHGGEGKGSTMAPALKGNEWVKAAAAGDITGVIKNGRAGKDKKYPKFFSPMPASKTMSESDLGSLAAYLKSLN